MIARRRRAALGDLPDTVLGIPITTENVTAFLMMGMLVGVVVGRVSFNRFFVEGITSEERRNILVLAAALGLWWGVDKVFDLKKESDDWMAAATQPANFQIGGSQ